MIKKIEKTLYVAACAALFVQAVGCGTLMYPERKGQRGGKIDAGVAVLDGVGLLFFLVPGIIAYAVDFSNGTIYLPGTYHGAMDMRNLKQAKFDPKHYTNADIEKIIKDETGCTVRIGQDAMRVVRLASLDEMMARFSEAMPQLKDSRMALSMK